MVLVVNTIGNLILIPLYGVVGASAATTLAYSLSLMAHLALQEFLNDTRWWEFMLPTRKDIVLFLRIFSRGKT
ncbi:polysaccharide biosynthesis C-terminal domain-containing protein [Salaquimonas pukyongi]|uniref:polysaccharide biosynthesis C-terminal domain-containing protein n=1 Tax=Salaquimonas pukyongi TaxID=2712698 RepID=UPI003D170F09